MIVFSLTQQLSHHERLHRLRKFKTGKLVSLPVLHHSYFVRNKLLYAYFAQRHINKFGQWLLHPERASDGPKHQAPPPPFRWQH